MSKSDKLYEYDNFSSGVGSPSVPGIHIGEPGSPVNAELLDRSLDIKKQLSQSFHHNPAGGISKPTSRRNSAFHPKQDDDDDEFDDQGNERKRRDNINDRIQELLTLVPPEYFQDAGKEAMAGLDDPGRSTGTKDGKPNKGQILTQAVEYIQHMQNLIDENNRKEVELTLQLKSLEMRAQGRANVPISVGSTSAEKALGEIGVGPHSHQYFMDVLLEATGKRDKRDERRD